MEDVVAHGWQVRLAESENDGGRFEIYDVDLA
mgnify:CR=1 FL=1